MTSNVTRLRHPICSLSRFVASTVPRNLRQNLPDVIHRVAEQEIDARAAESDQCAFMDLVQRYLRLLAIREA
jgi:hypothetical protein